MDAESILATGGMGGVTGIVLVILYKLLQKGIRSKCCGQSVEIGLQTPKNIEVKVDEAHSISCSKEHSRPSDTKRPPGSPGGQDISRAQSEEKDAPSGHSCSSSNFTTENPLHIAVP